MPKLRDLIKSLIAELVKAQAPSAFPEKINGELVMSGSVAAGDGTSLVLTQPMEGLIIQIGAILKQDNPALSRSHTDEEWTRRVRTAFGPPLASIDLAGDQDTNANTVLKEVRKAIDEDTDSETREYAFGCTLFSNNDMAPFAIGPTRFEPRHAWLERKLAEGAITAVMERRVRKQWSGDNVRKRINAIDSMRETDIIAAIGNCPYVCSVTTEGLARGAGKLKAQTAARLALTSIALWWETPSGALDGFNLRVDRIVRRLRSLVFVPGKVTLAGFSTLGRPHGPLVAPAKWSDILVRNKGVFEVVGELIEFYLSPTGSLGRPQLMNVLTQALLWFHEGCRDQVDLMAIVKFSATLDALASGGRVPGIEKLIKARLGPGPTDPIRTNGETVRQAVAEIYSDGRSRTIHGTNDNITGDWTATRRLSEELARYCLIGCLEWAATNTSDAPQLLMQ